MTARGGLRHSRETSPSTKNEDPVLTARELTPTPPFGRRGAVSFKVTRLLLAREDWEASARCAPAAGIRSGLPGADFRIHGEIQQSGGPRSKRWCSSGAAADPTFGRASASSVLAFAGSIDLG